MSKTTHKTKASLKELNELKQLKKAIVAGHEAVESCVKSAKDKSRQALAEAILEGQRFTRVKEILGFGAFTRWCKMEVKGISDKTIQNYMRTYNAFGKNTKPLSELPPTSLQKAYIALGIIKEDSDAPAHGPATAAAAQPGPVHSSPASAPKATLAEKVGVSQPKPEISKADALSRMNYLVKELLLDIQTKLQTNSVTIPQAKAATLAPLEAFFKTAKPAKK